MTVTLGNGRTVSASIRNCIGSRGRPMTDAELDAKFRLAAEAVLPADRTEALLASVRAIETVADAAVIARGARGA